MDNTVIKLELPADHKNLNVIGACLNAVLERIEHITDRDMLAYNLELALHETCTNIVEHAYSEERGRIEVVLSVVSSPQRQLVIDLFDTGKSFEADTASEPDLDNPQVHGYGLFLMRQLLDEVTYSAKTGVNHWRLVKKI